jgi:Protein of unknown function (DUF3108)
MNLSKCYILIYQTSCLYAIHSVRYQLKGNRIMSNQWRIVYLFTILLQMHLSNISAGEIAEKVSKPPFYSGETLHYQLSYQGLLTSMIWADVADAKMTFVTNKKSPEQLSAYQFVLNLSTENYSKVEVIHPVRYTYIATVDETMHRTLLVEKIDTGASDRHEFIWLDWLNKQIQLFKKREKKQLNTGLLWLVDKEVWEKDGLIKVPKFLSSFPLLDENQSYLIHKKVGSKITTSQILEPLSMIYHLRTQDIDVKKEIALIIKDNIRLYHIQRIGMEDIQINEIIHQAIKYKIEKKEKNDKYFYMWLSNDKKKIPLQFAADAPLGQLEIKLVKITNTDKLVAIK